jgi:hypothetical protein
MLPDPPNALYIAFDLSRSKWQIAMSDGIAKPRDIVVDRTFVPQAKAQFIRSGSGSDFGRSVVEQHNPPANRAYTAKISPRSLARSGHLAAWRHPWPGTVPVQNGTGWCTRSLKVA